MRCFFWLVILSSIVFQWRWRLNIKILIVFQCDKITMYFQHGQSLGLFSWAHPIGTRPSHSTIKLRYISCTFTWHHLTNLASYTIIHVVFQRSAIRTNNQPISQDSCICYMLFSIQFTGEKCTNLCRFPFNKN